MNIDNNKKAEKLLQIQLMSQIFKSALGDSDSFGLIMESLTKALSDDTGNIDLNKLAIGETDLSKLGYGAGERLNTIYKGLKNDIKSNNLSIDEAVEKASQKYGVDRDLIMAVIKQESDFDSKSVSGAGAMGLMQLMPDTARELGVSDPYNIGENVEGGTKYLKSLLSMYANNKQLALAAYNAGPGTLQNRGVTDVSGVSKLPYETRDYVNKVMKYYSGK